jgi:hypothetical protein
MIVLQTTLPAILGHKITLNYLLALKIIVTVVIFVIKKESMWNLRSVPELI